MANTESFYDNNVVLPSGISNVIDDGNGNLTLNLTSNNPTTTTGKAFLDEEGLNVYHSGNLKKIADEIGSHNSSSTAHEDMRSEINDLNDLAHGHANQNILDNTTASFTTALNNKLNNVYTKEQVDDEIAESIPDGYGRFTFRNSTNMYAGAPTDGEGNDYQTIAETSMENFSFIAGNNLIEFSVTEDNADKDSVTITINADPIGSADDALIEAKKYTDTSLRDKTYDLDDIKSTNAPWEFLEGQNLEEMLMMIDDELLELNDSRKSFNNHISDNTAHITEQEKEKLSTIENNANYYVHPVYTTPPDNENTLYKFELDNQGHVKNADYIEKSDLLDFGLADADVLNNHIADTTKHITSAERTKWNAAKSHADSDHAPINAEPNQNAFALVYVDNDEIGVSAGSTMGDIGFHSGDGIELSYIDGKKCDIDITIKNTGVTAIKGSAESSYRTGDVNITKANIGLGNVDNTSDIDKPISNAQQLALDELSAETIRLNEEGIINMADSNASIKNWLSEATDDNGDIYNGIGYKNGYRWSSSVQGESSVSGNYGITGYIPCSYLDVIRLKNIMPATTSSPYIVCFDSSKKYLGLQNVNTNLSPDAIGVYKIKMTTNESTAFVRLSFCSFNQDAIVTINQDFSLTGSALYGWLTNAQGEKISPRILTDYVTNANGVSINELIQESSDTTFGLSQSYVDEHANKTDLHMTSTDRTLLNNVKDHMDLEHVTGIKGSAETNYRVGNVNITPAHIGLGNVNNTADKDKPVSDAQQAAMDQMSADLIQRIDSKSIAIDSSLSLDSKNPVENQAITNWLSGNVKNYHIAFGGDGTSSYAYLSDEQADVATKTPEGEEEETPLYYIDNGNETRYFGVLWDNIDGVPYASTSEVGIVQLTDSISSTSTTTAATPKSVKQAYDLANEAKTLAGSVQTIADSKADAVHNHNDIYYTESEIDTKFDDTVSYIDNSVSGLISSTAVDGKINTHNTSIESHNDIRTLIEDVTLRLNALANSDDTTLDQLSEIIAYIKSNRSLIEEITTNKVNVEDIINNLTTNVSNKPLSAAQGVVIKAFIDELESFITQTSNSLSIHTSNQSNPHGVTLTQLGVTADAEKVNFVNDVTSNIQAQLNKKSENGHGHVISDVSGLQDSLDSKQTTITGGASTITSSNLTASRALVSNSNGKVAVSDITSTELNYLDGVTSNVQTQLDSRLKYTNTGTVGQFAISDGKGGITWLTVKNGNEVAY